MEYLLLNSSNDVRMTCSTHHCAGNCGLSCLTHCPSQCVARCDSFCSTDWCSPQMTPWRGAV